MEKERQGGHLVAGVTPKQFSPFEPPGLLDNIDVNNGLGHGEPFATITVQQNHNEVSKFGIEQASAFPNISNFMTAQPHQQRPGIDDTFSM